MEHSGRSHPIACRKTAFVFLVGCVAISALPPLNGFVSDGDFQAILATRNCRRGVSSPGAGGRCVARAVRSARPAASFKAFPASRFSAVRERPRPVRDGEPTVSLAAMYFLAALCLVAGVRPACSSMHWRRSTDRSVGGR